MKGIYSLAIVILMLSSSISGGNANSSTGIFGKDYWIIKSDGTEHIMTLDNWNFTVDMVQNYTLEGIILSLNYYNISMNRSFPSDIFSPVDIFVGIKGVSTNIESFPYTIKEWGHRYLFYDCNENATYFNTHVGNNHLIPNNYLSYKCMLNFHERDQIKIVGNLVNIYGTKYAAHYSWETDTKLGLDVQNSTNLCEVILVDNITVNGLEWGGIQIEEEPHHNYNNEIFYIGGIGALIAICVSMGYIWVERRKK